MSKKEPRPEASELRLQRQHEELFGSLPALFREAQHRLNTDLEVPLSAVVVRTYTTYSAYEAPIGEES